MLLLTKDQVRYERAQHIYINDAVPPPPPGTQIFCGNLPRNMGETELFPYFSLIGEVYEFRLMMEFSGFSRGFCFVTYMRLDHAEQAVHALHGYVLKDRQLSVHKSLNNTKLFLCGIPSYVMPAEIMATLQVQFPCIVNVTCKVEANTSKRHLGWAILEFDNHRNASLCRKQIWPNKLTAWGRILTIEWARPIKSAFAREKATLELDNLPLDFNKEDIYKLVKRKLNAPSLQQIYKKIGQSTAKLEFNTFSKAKHAYNLLLGLEYKDNKIVVRKYSTDVGTESHENSQRSPSCNASDCNTSAIAPAYYPHNNVYPRRNRTMYYSTSSNGTGNSY